VSEAVQNARRWLAAYDSHHDVQTGAVAQGAHHVRMLLDEMALQGRAPSEAGYDWFMYNTDQQVTAAINAGNDHHHHEEDIHLRVAMVRSNQAVAAAMRAEATEAHKPGWDEMTAREADAFQSVVMAVLNSSPGTVRSLPGYPDAVAHEVIAECDHDGTVNAETICAALIEAGPWGEIDGDGDEESLIVEHVLRLGKLALSDGQISQLQVQRVGAILEGVRGFLRRLDARGGLGVNIHEALLGFIDQLEGALNDLASWEGAKCAHGIELVDGVIDEMSAATDGDGIRLVITGEVMPRADIVDTMSVTVHHRPQGT